MTVELDRVGHTGGTVTAASETRCDRLRRLGLPPVDGVQIVLPAPEARVRLAIPGAAVPENAPPMLALIATLSHLPFAALAAESFCAYHPEFSVYLLVVDGTEADRTLLPGINIVLLSDLTVPEIGWFAAKLDATELSNALKPVFLDYLAAFGDRAIYMDCDIAVFSRFTTLIDALERSDLVLIPHMMALFPRPEEQWRHPNNADIFHAGLINAGCFGIRLAQCGAFLKFWEEANLQHAWSAGEGRQTDQQFLNWALVNCNNVHVLRDKGYNVAYWNLHERSFRNVAALGHDPVFEVDGSPLVFFHFSGFDPNDALRLSRHDQRYSVYTLPSIALVLDWYSRRLLTSPLAGFIAEPYRFDTLGNGVRVSPFLRNILKRYAAYLPHVDSRTGEGADTLCRILMAPLPATGSRLPLVAAVIYEARQDLREGYPGADTDLNPSGFHQWFCRHAGIEYDVEALVARFRRTLESDSLAGFAAEIEKLLPKTGKATRFLGCDRRTVAADLRARGRGDLAESLLCGSTEWFFYSDFSAILSLYANRPDLQKGYPDPFGASHQGYLKWLRDHGTTEQGLPMATAEMFTDKSASQVLARLYSFLSRREDLGALAIEEMLSEQPVNLIRALIRGAGDGLEYDLADVEIFCFLHRNDRAQLVPLFLELPPIRRQRLSSRTKEGRLALLPVPADQDWVIAGCRLHEANFLPFDVALEQEVRNLRAQTVETGRDVIAVLNASRLDVSAEQLTRIAEKQALRRLRAADSDTAVRPVREPASPGVNLFGYFHANTGVGESSRGLASALQLLTGVRRISQFTGHLEPSTRLTDVFAHYDHHADTNVFVSYPHAFEDLFGLLPSEVMERRRNIVHLAWEQRDWNTHWRSIYGRYDEIWSISDFAAQPFREMFGADKVRVVPNVLLVDDFPSTTKADAARFTRPVFRFLFVFDANSSMERKNPEAVLEAFTAAFAGTPRASEVELVFKVNNLNRPEHGQRVARLRRAAAASGLSVQFDGRVLPRNEVLMLIASADCYVSLHRAEGFGYTMAEAMYLGVPVIASGYSGNLEYMTSDNSYLVPCTEQLVQNADGPFQRGSIWGDPDVAAAADMMRSVVANRAAARRVGELGAASVRRKLLPEVVAEELRPLLGRSVLSQMRGAAE